jgi:ABC-type branched-subunit amino acid transport system substrate-binding protein
MRAGGFAQRQFSDGSSGDSGHPIKVFISYSWDTEEHVERVLDLAYALLEDGIDCMIDRFESPDNWDRWMLDQIENSDFVLIVCSQRYYDRYRHREEPNQGLGVKWESTLIMGRLFDLAGRNTKFYPLFFGNAIRSLIPDGVRNTYFAFQFEEIDTLLQSKDRLERSSTYQDLYRLLTNQPLTPKIERGPITILPPINRHIVPQDSTHFQSVPCKEQIPPTKPDKNTIKYPPNPPGPNILQNIWSWNLFKVLPFWIVILLFFIPLTALTISLYLDPPCFRSTDDFISEGEDILLPGTYPADPILKGQDSFRHCKYTQALSEFSDSWVKGRTFKSAAVNPEVLIYINNSLLLSRKIDHYTLAVAMGFKSRRGPTGNQLLAEDSDRNIADRSAEILRGVAQLQTKVNFGLLNDKDPLLNQILGSKRENFSQLNGMTHKGINRKGLKIIIVNDGNEEIPAKERARIISRNEEVKGLIGHYASDMTLSAIDTYSDYGLPVVSPGSTTSDLSDKPRGNFFRTVFSVADQSPSLVSFMSNRSITDVVIFYSRNSTFARPFYQALEKDFNGKARVLSLEGYESRLGDNDFNPGEAIRLIKSKPGINLDRLGIIMIPSPIGDAQTQSIELVKKINGTNWVLGSWGMRNPKILEGLRFQPESSSKFAIAVPWDPMSSEDRQFLNDALILWRTRKVAPVTATSYDAALVFLSALENVNPDNPSRLEILSQLRSTSVEGATGVIKFNNKGDRVDPRVEFVHIVSCKYTASQMLFNFAPISKSYAMC